MSNSELLRLEHCRLARDTFHNTLSGSVNGIELHFQTAAGQTLDFTAEPFIAAMLLPAMEQGCDIVIPDELAASSAFIANIHRVQDIFALWYPGFRKIRIHVRTDDSGNPDAERKGRGTALFFSGGLDASFSLHKLKPTIDALIYVRGADMQLDNAQLYEQCLASNREIADAFNKELVPIQSNVRFFIRQLSRSGIGWTKGQGCGMASIALALGFPVTIISSSNTYDHLHPLSSHPLTDPLFSSDRTKIRHEGCETRRHQKLQAVAQNDFLLQRVRVCWQDSELNNCGKCDKCLHFRMALTLCGLKTRNFAPLTDYSELVGAHVGTLGEYVEWEDNLILARKMGHEPAIRALDRLLKRYKKKQLFKLIDEIWFDGGLKRKKQQFTQAISAE